MADSPVAGRFVQAVVGADSDLLVAGSPRDDEAGVLARYSLRDGWWQTVDIAADAWVGAFAVWVGDERFLLFRSADPFVIDLRSGVIAPAPPPSSAGNAFMGFVDGALVRVPIALMGSDEARPDVYDPARNEWRRGTPTPVVVSAEPWSDCCFTRAAAIGEELVLFVHDQGSDASRVWVTPWAYSPAQDRWRQLPQLALRAGHTLSGEVALGASVLAVDSGGHTHRLDRDAWRDVGLLADRGAAAPPPVALDGAVVASTNGPLRVFDPSAGQWRTGPPSPSRSPLRLAPARDALFGVDADGEVWRLPLTPNR